MVHSKRDFSLQKSNFHTWAAAFRWDLDFKLSNVDPVRMSTEAVPYQKSWGGVADPVAQEDKDNESENS